MNEGKAGLSPTRLPEGSPSPGDPRCLAVPSVTAGGLAGGPLVIRSPRRHVPAALSPGPGSCAWKWWNALEESRNALLVSTRSLPCNPPTQNYMLGTDWSSLLPGWAGTRLHAALGSSGSLGIPIAGPAGVCPGCDVSKRARVPARTMRERGAGDTGNSRNIRQARQSPNIASRRRVFFFVGDQRLVL